MPYNIHSEETTLSITKNPHISVRVFSRDNNTNLHKIECTPNNIFQVPPFLDYHHKNKERNLLRERERLPFSFFLMVDYNTNIILSFVYPNIIFATYNHRRAQQVCYPNGAKE